MSEIKPFACPACGSGNVKKIVYGRLSFKTDDERQEFFRHNVTGGCLVHDNMPAYQCGVCWKKFGKARNPFSREER